MPQARTVAEIPTDAKLIGQGVGPISFTSDQNRDDLCCSTVDDRQVFAAV
jgi:hypothetical protein